MAITHRGSAFNQGDTSATATTGVHGISIQSGDLVVVNVHANNNGSITANQSGWETALYDSDIASETGHWLALWKVAGGSEPSEYTFDMGTTRDYGCTIQVFQCGSTPEIDRAAKFVRGSTGSNLNCTAQSGETISAYAVSIIVGGKDTRASTEAYTTADNSYDNGVYGDKDKQITACCHRIDTTGSGFTGPSTVVIQPTDGSDDKTDNTYSLHVSFVEGSGAISQAIATATETDASQALSKLKEKATTQSSEADSALALTRQKSRTLGVAQEADSSFAITLDATFVRSIGTATEADSALVITVDAGQTVAIATALEADSALAITADVTHVRAIGTALESDAALPVTTDVTKVRAIGTATESDAALTITTDVTIIRTLGLASESDTALPITFAGGTPVGTASEADSAIALGRSKAKAIATATEADSALTVTVQLTTVVAISTALETDAAQALGTTIKAKGISIALETDTARPITSVPVGTVDGASTYVLSTDSAFVTLYNDGQGNFYSI